MKKDKKSDERIADFLFEVGTMRKLIRIHRQPFLSDDVSDNIASHSYRVAIIGWILAKREGVDPNKVLLMCLLHDIGEVRSNDHNWIHKKYVKIFNDEILADQVGTLPFDDFLKTLEEYEKRESKESILAKEADTLDQILLLKEYEWQGNKEAHKWLYGEKPDLNSRPQLKKLKMESSKELGEVIYTSDPSNWWKNSWTGENR